jgi:dTDP-glucose pyrophosphorylase
MINEEQLQRLRLLSLTYRLFKILTTGAFVVIHNKTNEDILNLAVIGLYKFNDNIHSHIQCIFPRIVKNTVIKCDVPKRVYIDKVRADFMKVIRLKSNMWKANYKVEVKNGEIMNVYNDGVEVKIIDSNKLIEIIIEI